MLYNISRNLIEKVFGKEDSNIDNYIYGLELFISSIAGTVLLLVIGIILNAVVESALFIVGFSTLRIFCGGFHSRSFVLCNIITIFNFGAVITVYRCFYYILVSPFVFVFIFVLSFIITMLCAPVINSNNPINDAVCQKCKIKSMIIIALDAILFVVLLFVLEKPQIAIIIPTLFSVDVFMIIPILKPRRKKNEKL